MTSEPIARSHGVNWSSYHQYANPRQLLAAMLWVQGHNSWPVRAIKHDEANFFCSSCPYEQGIPFLTLSCHTIKVLHWQGQIFIKWENIKYPREFITSFILSWVIECTVLYFTICVFSFDNGEGFANIYEIKLQNSVMERHNTNLMWLVMMLHNCHGPPDLVQGRVHRD